MDAGGTVTVANPASATGGVRRVTFNTALLTVSPGAFPGEWKFEHITGQLVGGPYSVQFVPGTTGMIGVGTGSFSFAMSNTGDVTIDNAVSATGGLRTITLRTDVITVDPQAYAGGWRIDRSTAANQMVFGRGTAVVVPGVLFSVNASMGLTAFSATLGGDGRVSVTNGVSATGGTRILSFNTVRLRVDPSTYTGDWRVHDVGPVHYGPYSEYFVRGTRSLIVAAVGNQFIDIDGGCGVTPNSFNLGVHVFTVACDPDVTGPVITTPSNLTVEASSAAGRTVTFAVSVSDDIDPAPSLACSRSSGSVFALGSTQVSCSASDAAGNQSSATFFVAVVDSTPPVLSGVPVDRSAEATGPAGAAVAWLAPTAADLVSGAVAVICAPGSGSTFPVAITIVTCAAVDAAGNRSEARFQVWVTDRVAPTVTLISPSRDAVITSLTDVTVGVSDLVGVTQVSDQYAGTSFSRIAGSAQAGSWRGSVLQGRSYYRTWYYQGRTYGGYIPTYSDITIRARDAGGNTATTTVIDNDGIASSIDRSRINASLDQSGTYSTQFNDGITSGSLISNSGYMTAAKVGAAIRVTVLSRAPWQWMPYVTACAGSEKQVILPNVGDTVDLVCQGNTLTVRVVSTASRVEVWKHIWGTSCYYFSGCYNYDYWTNAYLTTGQSYSTGSPSSTDPSNQGLVTVDVRRMAPTAADESFVDPLAEPHSELSVEGFQISAHDLVSTVIATAELAPGTTAEISIVSGAEPSGDQLQLAALAGTVAATVQGVSHVIAEGQQVTASAAPKLDQTISFGALADRAFGAPPFAAAATASSGLPVSYGVGGGSACSVAGDMVSVLGTGTCTVVATQGGSDRFNAATPVTQSFSIGRAPQTVNLAALPVAPAYGDPAIGLGASSTSGLSVSLTASGACSLSGPTTLAFTGWGLCTVVASQDGDVNYQPAPSVTRTTQVSLSWSGVLQPINTDDSSIFKQGSTVPVKFKLTGASAPVTNLPAQLFLAQVSNGVIGSELEAVSTVANDGGNTFRYDAASGQYIFNLGTKGMAQGTWQIRVDLRDGVTRTVLVSLKK
ncbi:MAG TPA: PxKF domain-containing protein [Vicinamibacterales bacterium]|nr:PxKF domain-containing protein [Vicinamibacterales bacterium]